MTEEDEAFNEIERRSKVKQTLIETLPKQEQDGNVCARCGGIVFDPVVKQEQGEPVYHLRSYGDVTKDEFERYIATGDINATPQPAQKQEQGEPVAWGMQGKDGFIFDVICPAEHEREEGGYTTPLYTTPQQCTWVGLTDDEKRLIEVKHGLMYFEAVFFDIEAKLKEKNTNII